MSTAPPDTTADEGSGSDTSGGGIEIRAPVERLIAELGAPDGLVEGETAEVIQTHISIVFLTSKRAWKVKKPVRLWGLLDYGTVAVRKHWCEEEVRLNRRMAPEIYLGVVAIHERDGRLSLGTLVATPEDAEDDSDDESVMDHAVEMRRIPKGVTLKERVDAGALQPAELERIGRRLAELHAGHRLDGEAANAALPGRFGRVLQRNLRASAQGVPDLFPEALHAGLVTRLARRLWQARTRIRRRVHEGRIVDGHGDIRLEHVLRYEGRTAIMDCCEFNAVLRHVDPLSDAAFLSMDLLAHGRPDLARAFERSYLEHAGEPDGGSLLPLYRAYRAQVRAMVDEQSRRDPQIDEATRAEKTRGARRAFVLAWSQARTGAAQPLIVLRGAAGTGKSWLATRLAPWLGAEIIRSDVVRKELLGLEATWRPDAEQKHSVYGSEMHARTYEAVLDRARAVVGSGHAAFLDATYLRRASRDAVHAAAKELGVPFLILDVTCEPDVVRVRLKERAARGDDASDADESIYEEMLRSAEPIAEEERAYTVSFASGGPAEAAALDLIAGIEAQADAHRETLGPDPKPWRPDA
jgi:aminoglycoside phosphotransferase family enzyme/predicted kinase